MEKELKFNLGKVIGFIYIVWFVASVVALLITYQNNRWISGIIIGQLFFFWGIFALILNIKKGNFAPWVCLVSLLGIGVILFSLNWHYNFIDNEIVKENALPYAASLIFVLVGIALLLGTITRAAQEKKCTVLVRAVCTDLDARTTNHSAGDSAYTIKCPVFTFDYNGKTYSVNSGTYSGGVKAVVGQEYDLYINPDDPELFMEEGESKRLKALDFFYGPICIALGIIVFLVTKFA